jgi:dTDP-4-amino-4,6-dideoxygalactose transaminase
MASGYLGMGPETRAFEAELASYLGGQRHVICVNTGTSALHLAVAALGLEPGDEVLVPAFTFVASFQAITAAGARPRLCDIDPLTGLLDLGHARSRLRPSVKAIMPVHFGGSAGNFEDLLGFANTHGLRVIEDAAHAFGSRCQERLIGSFGDLTCFSFDPIKNITSGEGGAVVTADAELAGKLRAMRTLGVDSAAHPLPDGSPDILAQGWRYHMPDLAAAIGRVQLARFETELKPTRLALAGQYRLGLADAPRITPLPMIEGSVPHIMPVRVRAGLRPKLVERLAADGFETRIHYRPGYHYSAFADDTGFPGAEQLFSEILSLPLHGGVSAADVSSVTAHCLSL